MEEKKRMIRDDINFLEYPSWVITKKRKVTRWTIKKDHGTYEIISSLGLPNNFDKIVVYYILYKLYHDHDFSVSMLTTNRHTIAKNIFEASRFGQNTYNRIMIALKKWASVTINFKGVFHEGNKVYSERCFHVIEQVDLETNGTLTVRFNASYIKQLKETKFYKYINFDQYKKLHKTSSSRLYEVLCKSFKERKEWAINLQDLAEKLTFEMRQGAKSYYPSDVLRYLRPAVKEINKKTDMHIKMEYNKNTGVCVFKCLPPRAKNFIPAVVDKTQSKKERNAKEKERRECLDRFNRLPLEEQQFVRASVNDNPLYTVHDEETRIYIWMSQHHQQKQ